MITILVHLVLRISVCHIYAVFRTGMNVHCAKRAQRRNLSLAGEIFWQGRAFQVGKWLEQKPKGKWEVGGEF